MDWTTGRDFLARLGFCSGWCKVGILENVLTAASKLRITPDAAAVLFPFPLLEVFEASTLLPLPPLDSVIGPLEGFLEASITFSSFSSSLPTERRGFNRSVG